jgi:triosephosphate isomerase
VAEIVADSNVKLGAQNVHWEEQGAFTGEISPGMIADTGAEWVIVGHSERRTLFGDTGETINLKLKSLLNHKLHPILCVGETLQQREADEVAAVLTMQLQEALQGLTEADMSQLTIAYEPIWAIGTGKVATPEQADLTHKLLRDWLSENYSDQIANNMRILYGGSVKPDNAADLFSCSNINGALIGGAALKVDDFAAIINAAEELSKS